MLGDREDVDRLARREEREHRLVDRAVALAVEVLLAERLLDDVRVVRAVRLQDRAEDGLLGLDRCGGTAPGWGGRRCLRSGGAALIARARVNRAPRPDADPEPGNDACFVARLRRVGTSRPEIVGRLGRRRPRAATLISCRRRRRADAARPGWRLGDDRLDRRGHAVVDLDDHHVGADVRIGSSRWTLRRSTVMPRASGSRRRCPASVTEPNRRPSSPACCEIVRTVRLRSSACSWERRDGLLLGARLGLGLALGGLDGALRRGLGELARDEEVAQVALRDVDDGRRARRRPRRP